MTVLDNIRLGRHIRLKSGIASGSIYAGKTAKEEAEHRQFIEEEIIDLLEIESIRSKPTGMLPYGLQKRVELGRALALEPELLILDEATSQIDIESERLIHKALENFLLNRTAIMITHRLSTLDLARRVIVMDAGSIVDCGTHEELLARCSLYSRLHESQLKHSA